MNRNPFDHYKDDWRWEDAPKEKPVEVPVDPVPTTITICVPPLPEPEDDMEPKE